MTFPRHTPTSFAALLAGGWLFAFSFLGLQTHAQQQGYGRWDTVPVWGMDGGALTNPWTGGLTAPQYSEADLDGDGIGDLFIFDRSGNRILAFQGCLSDVPEATLTYYHRPDWRTQFPEGLRNWVLLRDANCDGVMDLFANSQSGMRIWPGSFEGGLTQYPDAPTSNVIANWDFGSGDQQLPLVCLNTDIPALGDFDGDGDLDMVTWTETSSTLYSYTGRGLTAESVGCGDTLIWDVTNRCFGMLDEATEDNTVFIGSEHQCDFNVAEPRAEDGNAEAETTMRHAGGTTALLELDGDGHLDLLLGDVSYNQFVTCYMTDASDGQDSTMNTTTHWPADLGDEDTLDIQRFPAAYPIDADQDGVRDLMIAPNATFEIDGRFGSWFYRNAGTASLPEWTLMTKAFLQEGMIDLGRGAYPAFTDFDGDGDMDMVVANKERYIGPGNTPALLARFRNVGTPTSPAFEQLDTNWLALPDYGLESVALAFGDTDGDGDDDLILGDELGNLHRWENTAETGAEMALVLAEPSMPDASGTAIDVGQFATPCLYDLDDDGDLDLLVGEKNGNLNLFENTGSASAPIYTSVTASTGQVLADNLLGINGFAVPAIWPTDSGLNLVIGNELGRLQLYSLPDAPMEEPESEWTEVTAQWLDLYEGEFAAPALADLNADGTHDLVVGVRDGGLTLWNGQATEPALLGCTAPDVIDGVADLEEANKTWDPYPNPLRAGARLTVPSSAVFVLDLTGRPLGRLEAQGGSVHWPEIWGAGTYLVLPEEGRNNQTGALSHGKGARRLVIIDP